MAEPRRLPHIFSNEAENYIAITAVDAVFLVEVDIRYFNVKDPRQRVLSKTMYKDITDRVLAKPPPETEVNDGNCQCECQCQRQRQGKRTYDTVCDVHYNVKGYAVQLTEVSGLVCAHGYSGGPLLNNESEYVGCYHGTTDMKGYAVGLEEIRRFLFRFQMLTEWPAQQFIIEYMLLSSTTNSVLKFPYLF
uniref:Uncharacterized protein n=1 Tax=Oryza brachyantha TaxID=4533 RepID=J3M471_ORYBR